MPERWHPKSIGPYRILELIWNGAVPRQIQGLSSAMCAAPEGR